MEPSDQSFDSDPESQHLEFLIRGKQGDVDAQLSLGFIYWEGSKGTQKDPQQALMWFTMAADQGHDAAQTMMGHFCHRGEIVEQNDAEATRWYRLAADQGNRSAQLMMGELHFKGTGVIEDYVEAYKYFNLAAAQGREGAAKRRNQVRKLLTREQLAEGQRRAALLSDRRAS